MKFKITLSSLLLFLFVCQAINAQSIPRDNRSTSSSRVVESSGFTKENLFIEPQVGFSVSNNFTQLSLTPYLGYSFNQTIAAGFGGGYSFVKQNGVEDRLNQWQASIFGEAQIIGEGLLSNGSRIYVRAEFGQVWLKFPDFLGTESEWQTETILPVGGGIRLGAGRVTLVNINVLYNILYREGESILGSPIIYQPSIRWYFAQGR